MFPEEQAVEDNTPLETLLATEPDTYHAIFAHFPMSEPELPIDELLRIWMMRNSKEVPFVQEQSLPTAYLPIFWLEVFRVMRPGAHLLGECSNQSLHLFGLLLRMARFEIRDTIQFNFDGRTTHENGFFSSASNPVILARKPLAERTVALNVLRWETGGLNIDATRTPSDKDHWEKCLSVVGLDSNRTGSCYGEWNTPRTNSYHQAGRFPANVLFDRFTADLLDEQSGVSVSRKGRPRKGKKGTGSEYSDIGGASRFFHVFESESQDEKTRHSDMGEYLKTLVSPSTGKVLIISF